MNNKWKVVIGIVVLLMVAAGVFASVKYSQRGVVTVQTGHAVRQDLASVVTASGEIRPRNYINIGANAQGDLTQILVKEGDHVKKGQLLARIENVQPEADVTAQKATLASAEADAAASEAAQKASETNIDTMAASIEQSKADLEKAQLEFQRGEELYKQHLIARQDYDQRKSAFDGTKAAVQVAQARLAQAKAQMAQSAATTASSQKRVSQIRANLARYTDVLRKFDSFSPLDGVVTNLPVRVGESVVPGVQNSAGSTIMTIADMSIITSEVKVDETDIVNVQLNQQADVTIDAIPNRTFKGHVIEIGNTAIVRSTGLAASQSNTSNQEAKDFKVVVAIDNPPDDLRPGLSSTSKVTTAVRPQALTIPIQALTVRQKGDLDPKHKPGTPPTVKPDPATEKANKEEIQGVFVVANGKAVFRKVAVGITGATDIEVTNGLKDGEEIVTGTYQVIRTLRTDASVKVDNTPPVIKPAT